MNALVSIICAAYNSSLYIEDTIRSILSQTYLNWELIIIDDCSTDNTVEIATKYVNSCFRVNLIRNIVNSGPGVTRNNGIAVAKGQYIAICDSDDIWFPEKLEHQISFMQKKQIAISYTSYELINLCGSRLNKTVRVANSPIGYTDYLKNTIIGFSTSVIDRNICKCIIFEDMRSREDTFLWCTLLQQGYMAYGIDEVLVQYRIRDSSVSANKMKAATQVWNLYNKKLQIPLGKCLFYFSCYVFHAFKKRFL